MGTCQHCGKATDRSFFWDGWDEVTGEHAGGIGFDCGCTDPIPTYFGLAIRKWRKDNQMTLREFGNRTNLTPVQVSDIERGKHTPSAGAVYQMAHAVGISAVPWLDAHAKGSIA